MKARYKQTNPTFLMILTKSDYLFYKIKAISSFRSKVLVIGFMLFALSNTVSAANYYVATWGNNSSDGSLSSPWRNISYATQQAKAGDTIYLINGTWYQEYCIFANSGNATHPIKLTKYNGTVILDGLDYNTGTAINIRDKSYIEISDITIKNYYKAIDASYYTSMHLNIHDFIIEKIGYKALDFAYSTPQNILIANFTISETGKVTSAPAIDGYWPSNCFNITITNFTIKNINGDAINWRNSKWVYIGNGKVYDSGPVVFQNWVNDSIIENMTIINTTWWGIAIHDHTVGSYPCYNNTIRNCYIKNAKHNFIDLHSGAFNTTVENCTLEDGPAGETGIYFHNLGAGLIARNNKIINTGSGIGGGPMAGKYIKDIIIENNTIYDLSQGISFSGDNENFTIRNNTIYNTSSYRIYISVNKTSFVFIEKNKVAGGEIRVDGGTGEVIDHLDPIYYVCSQYGSNITVKYTDNKVFKREITHYYGSYVLSDVKHYPSESNFTMSSSPSSWIYTKITSYNLTAVPSSNYAVVIINNFNTSLPIGEFLVDFLANTSDGNNVVFTTSTLKHNTYYIVKKDGNYFLTTQADSKGKITFNNSVWPKAITFTIEEKQPLKSFTFTFDLNSGWNLISLPIINNNSFTAASLANAIGKDNVRYILKHNSATDNFQSYIIGFSSNNDDFEIKPDHGYYIYVLNATSFTIEGLAPGIRSINLTKGRNLIGWTSLNISNATLAFVKPLGNNIKYVQKRLSNGTYQTYQVEVSKLEDDFEVKPGNGYFVYVENDCILTYG